MNIIDLLIMKVRVSIFIITLFISIGAGAQRIDTKKPATPYKKTAQLNDGLQTATMKDVRIDEKIIRVMTDSILNGNYTNVHSLLISQNDKLVYEQYWPGKDKKFGRELGVIPHHRDSLHGTQSVTKSFVSACLGIALGQGKFKSIDQRVFELFPEYKAQDTGLKSVITIRHLLTMTCGIKWNEEDYNSPDNMEHAMLRSSDPVGYVLSQPMVSVPGKVFNYNGGATQLLAAIVERTTGMPVDLFAKKYLFNPLGVTDFYWSRTNNNSIVPDATSGLYLRSRDMLKFGLLYMNNGKWRGKQVVPADWVWQSITPFIVADDGSDIRFGKSEYGFQWWIVPDTIKGKRTHIAACIGNGGQRIFIDKQNKLVTVFTGGNYRMPDKYLQPYQILKNFIYPAVNSTNSATGNSSSNQRQMSTPSGHPEALIKNLTHKAFEAEFKNDTAAISNLMDDDFISVYPHKTQKSIRSWQDI
jgi:CubicO group peptidase (beta-lactamase class C family)